MVEHAYSFPNPLKEAQRWEREIKENPHLLPLALFFWKYWLSETIDDAEAEQIHTILRRHEPSLLPEKVTVVRNREVHLFSREAVAAAS